jgi:hypothetical protein
MIRELYGIDRIDIETQELQRKSGALISYVAMHNVALNREHASHLSQPAATAAASIAATWLITTKQTNHLFFFCCFYTSWSKRFSSIDGSIGKLGAMSDENIHHIAPGVNVRRHTFLVFPSDRRHF